MHILGAVSCSLHAQVFGLGPCMLEDFNVSDVCTHLDRTRNWWRHASKLLSRSESLSSAGREVGGKAAAYVC